MRKPFCALVSAAVLLFGVVPSVHDGAVSRDVLLTAAHALKGTQIPLFNITSDAAIQASAVAYGVGTALDPAAVVNYPASWAPFSPGGVFDPTWDQSVRRGIAALQAQLAGDPAPVVFGYSQGAVIGSEYKKSFNANPTPGVVPNYVFVGNGARPNGGILSRFVGLYVPGLDMTATGAAPTHTVGAAPGQLTTRDYAGQYDPIADFPTNPLNPVALLNAGLGAVFVHLGEENPQDAVLQDRVGDTAYYLYPTYPVPLLVPVQLIPVIGPLIADALDPLVRLIVEAGYDRTVSPGQPAAANIGYVPAPAALAADVPRAIATGVDNLLQGIGFGRVLQTDRPQVGPGTTGQGAYGIGGPPVTMTAEQPEPTTTDERTVEADSGPRLNVSRPSPMAIPDRPGTDPAPAAKIGDSAPAESTAVESPAPESPTPESSTPESPTSGAEDDSTADDANAA